ncbi:MAG: glycosyltransferase, partial [Alphaproteobacteria bacterium]
HDLFYGIGGVYANDPRPTMAQGILAACPEVSCYFGGMFGQPHIFGPAYYAKLATVKMGLNYSRENNVYLYSSDRMAQYMGNGLLTFVHRNTGFGDLFSDEEIAFFSNTHELHEKIRFYAKADAERIRIARQGWEKIHTVFSSAQVSRFMIQCAVEEAISPTQFHWPTQIF